MNFIILFGISLGFFVGLQQTFSANTWTQTLWFFCFSFAQIVYAKTDLKAGPHGITAFIIEKGMEGYIQTPENWEPWVLMF